MLLESIPKIWKLLRSRISVTKMFNFQCIAAELSSKHERLELQKLDLVRKLLTKETEMSTEV